MRRQRVAYSISCVYRRQHATPAYTAYHTNHAPHLDTVFHGKHNRDWISAAQSTDVCVHTCSSSLCDTSHWKVYQAGTNFQLKFLFFTSLRGQRTPYGSVHMSLYWNFLYELEPNIMVEWLALLFRIQEIPCSNLGLEWGYFDWGFSWFSSVFPGKCCGTASKFVLKCFIVLNYFVWSYLDVII
jgi:hypothetical protein